MGLDSFMFLGRFFLQNQGGGFVMRAFFLGQQLAQFGGVAHDRAGRRMPGHPLAHVLAVAVQIMARLAGEVVLDPPDFFKKRIRFHQQSLTPAWNFPPHLPRKSAEPASSLRPGGASVLASRPDA